MSIRDSNSVMRGLLFEFSAKPLLPLVLGTILGVWFASAYSISEFWVPLFIASIVWLLLWVLLYKKYSVVFLLLPAGGILLGLLSVYWHSLPNKQDDHVAKWVEKVQPIAISGVVQRAPENGQRAIQIYLNAYACDDTPCDGVVLIYSTDPETLKIRAGQKVKVNLRLRPPYHEGTPGSFDYAEYLTNRGIWATAFVRNASAFEQINAGKMKPFGYVFECWRQDIRDWISATVPNHSRELSALAIGMRKGIPQSVREIFAKNGTSHLLAISGLHLGVITVWFYQLIWLAWRKWYSGLRYFTAHQVAAGLSFPLVWFYALLAGLSVATLRAAIMISVYLLARIFWRRSDGLTSLSLAVIIILIAMPYSLFEVSFQLSVISVLAIVLAIPILDDTLPGVLRGKLLLNYLRFVLLTSLVCFFATAPILAMHFHQFSYLGLLMNLIIVPVFSLLLIPILAFATGLWFLSPVLATYPLYLSQSLFHFTLVFQAFMSKLVGGVIHGPSPAPWITVTFYAGILLCLAYLSGRRLGKKRGSALLLVGFLLFAVSLSGWRIGPFGLDDSESKGVWVPHLRYGTSAVVSLPRGQSAVVSPGRVESLDSENDSSEETISRLLWKLGHRSIDQLLRTSNTKSEKKAAQILEERIPAAHQESIYDFTGCNLLTDSWTECPIGEIKNSYLKRFVWNPMGNRESVVLVFSFNESNVFVIPSPHKLPIKSIKLLASHISKGKLVVVSFGPGRLDSFKEIVSSWKPSGIVLAMNRKLSRYLSNANWGQMTMLQKNILRTDRDGSVHISSNGDVQSLAKRYSFNRPVAD